MKRLASILVVVLLTASFAAAQPLFDYIHKADGAFAWEKVNETKLANGCTLTTLKLTSQIWQGLTWTHQLAIIKPADLKTADTAVLLINGGKLGPAEMSYAATIAAGIGAPIVYLGDIPNQPLFNNLHEDALIAYTFQKQLETGDKEWPLLFPMTKAAVRAMDAVEQFTQREWAKPVNRFVVTGASKRGWTTWFTGEADPKRVVGIAPIVYDNLNLTAQMALQKSSYGAYSLQIEDYTALSLPDLLQTDAGKAFGATVDPYTYRDRAKMPKLVINGSNDPYWVVDSSNLYFNDLVGPKCILYLPNTGHANSEFVRLLNAEIGFFLSCVGRAPLPKLDWHFTEGENLNLSITSDIQPRRVAAWTAISPTRDFRQATWVATELDATDGQYTCHLPRPKEGYAAMFGEVLYGLDGRDIPLSTTIQVIKAQ